MTGQEALNLLMGRLGNRTATTLRATCLSEMKQVQATKLERGQFMPWFMLTEDASATLTVGERRLALPSDFVQEPDEEDMLRIVDDSGGEQKMFKKEMDFLQEKYAADAGSDLPREYALVGGYFMIFPKPNIARTVKMRYYASQALPTDSSAETTWLKYAADWLLGETGILLAGLHVQMEPVQLQLFQAEAAAGRARVYTETVARAEANLDRRMGDPS